MKYVHPDTAPKHSKVAVILSACDAGDIVSDTECDTINTNR